MVAAESGHTETAHILLVTRAGVDDQDKVGNQRLKRMSNS
jgi:hypothetical protein